MKAYVYIMLLLNLMFYGCGSDKPESEEPSQQPQQPSGGQLPPPSDGGVKISYQQMQGHLVQYCQSCHSSALFMQNESELKKSSVKLRISNRTMPPASSSKKLPDNIRTQMLSYFD